jgi:hypothetical protein
MDLALTTTDAAVDSASQVVDPPHTITLDQPIKRGTKTIDKVTLRRPTSGELRGIQLVNLMQMDVTSLSQVIPRISIPTLTKPEVEALDPADLVQFGTEVVNFLLRKVDRVTEFPTE